MTDFEIVEIKERILRLCEIYDLVIYVYSSDKIKEKIGDGCH